MHKTNKESSRAQADTQHEKTKKAKMMIAFQTALIAGTIVAVAGGFLISYGNHKVAAVWITFSGVVLLALSGALYLHAEALPESKPPDPVTPPTPTPAMSDKSINISSTNQSGGITAHTVNVSTGTPERRITEGDVPIFVSALGNVPKCSVRVERHGMSAEAASFSEQVFELVRRAGFSIEGPINVTISPDVYPPLTIAINDPSNPPEQAARIQSALQKIGIGSVIKKGGSDQNSIILIVGPQ